LAPDPSTRSVVRLGDRAGRCDRPRWALGHAGGGGVLRLRTRFVHPSGPSRPPDTSPVSRPVSVRRRHRRPSGEPPPLPPEPDARWWLWFGGAVLLLGIVVASLFRR